MRLILAPPGAAIIHLVAGACALIPRGTFQRLMRFVKLAIHRPLCSIHIDDYRFQPLEVGIRPKFDLSLILISSDVTSNDDAARLCGRLVAVGGLRV